MLPADTIVKFSAAQENFAIRSGRFRGQIGDAFHVRRQKSSAIEVRDWLQSNLHFLQ